MSNLNQRQRRHEATRARLLDAAIAIAREEGWAGVTMRKLADRIDYTHPALYAYFANKDDLLLALVRDGNERFRASMQLAAASTASLEARVIALARAQWTFAWDHPELYQVMHGLGGVAFASAETRDEGLHAGDPAIDVVAAVLGSFGQDPTTAVQKTQLLWSTIHGLVALTMAGRFEREEGAALVTEAACDALIAWRADGLADCRAPGAMDECRPWTAGAGREARHARSP